MLTTTADPTLTALVAAVRADWRDWNCRRVYADALEERGDVVLANAMRWMASRRKHPTLGRASGKWIWLYGYGTEGVECVGRLVMQQMAGVVIEGSSHKIEFATIDDAEAALAKALWELGILVRGDE